MTRRFDHLFFVVLIAGGITANLGCDSSPESQQPQSESVAVSAKTFVQSVHARPLAGKNGDDRYVLTVTLHDDATRLRLPAAINVLSRRPGSPNTLIYDNGKGHDRFRGDGVFTGLVEEACIPVGTHSGDSAAKDAEFSCKFDIVGPGEECGGYGECPETVHRSLLWGLIEYDVDILFCFCLVECTITK